MSSEKTEKPTAQRQRSLRKKGDVPVSREVNRNLALVCALAGMLIVARQLPSWVRGSLSRIEAATAHPLMELEVFVRLITYGLSIILGTAALGSVIAGLGQTEFLFSIARLKPDLQRLKFGHAWKSRLQKEVWFQGFFALLITMISLWVGYAAIRSLCAVSPGLLRTVGHTARPIAIIGPLSDLILKTGVAWLSLALLATAIDFAWQRISFQTRNKMSQKEIEDEYKQSEGDPQNKAKRKELHREILSSSPARAIAEASVIIRNPTHVAIVLKYDPQSGDAPIITSSGRGDTARQILKMARAVGVPEFADPPVARALIHVPIGEPIPEELFEPVAVIFRWLLDSDGRNPYDDV